jgi:PAS domain S-box-containing protein
VKKDLKDLEEKVVWLRRMFQYSPTGLCFFDTDLQYVYINDWLATINGLSVDDHLGRRISEVLPDVAAGVESQLRHVIETGEPVMEGSVLAATPAHPEVRRHFQHDYCAVKSDEGTIVGVSCVVQDITARKLAEEQVRQLTTDLQHASRLSVMGEMAAGVAHELHQPLAVIANFANGCRRRLEERNFDVPKMVDSMEQITSAAMRAGQIISRIKAFIAKEPFETQALDVNEAVRDALELAKLAVRQKGVIVEESLSENLPQVTADRIQVVQVVLNLVFNGIEAMTDVEPERRKLTVRTLVDGDQYIRVEITDVGSGVAQSDGDKIFEQFVTTKPGGLGMGLSISRTIVEAHGGKIWFDSEPPSGSVFRFTLPPIRHVEAVS